MAIVYVDDAATAGGDDGTTWEDAYLTLLQAADNATSSDEVYVASTHDETVSIAVTYDWNGGFKDYQIPVTSRDVSDDTYLRGAKVQTDGVGDDIFIRGYAAFCGVSIQSFGDFKVLDTTVDGVLTFKDCDLGLTATSESSVSIFFGRDSFATEAHYVKLTEVALQFNNSNNHIQVRGAVFLEMVDCSDSSSSPTYIFRLASACRLYCYACDFSNQTNNIFGATGAAGVDAKLVGCKFNSGVTVLPTGSTFFIGQAGRIMISNSQSDTLTDPLWEHRTITYRGTVIAVSTPRMVGGSKDRERTNPISHEMKAVLGRTRAFYQPLCTDWSGGWTDGDGSTSKDFTVEVAHAAVGAGTGGLFENDELGLEILTPPAAAASSGMVYSTTRPEVGVTPSDIATSDETWEGSDVGTEQKLVVTVTPGKPGPFLWRVFLAPTDGASDTIVHINGKCTVTDT